MNALPVVSSLAFLALLAPLPAAQTPVVLVARDETVPGVGNVTEILNFAINDAGEWLAHVLTDAAADPEVVLRDGFLSLRQGTILGKPVGSRIASFRSLNIDAQGNSLWDLGIGTNSAVPEDLSSGIFYNAKLIANGETANPPNNPLAPGMFMNLPGYGRSARWLRFNGVVKANNKNQLVVGCVIDDPSITGAADDALVLLTVDSQGNILSSVDIAHELGTVAALNSPVSASNGLPLTQGVGFDINDRGDVLWQVRTTGPTAVMLNETVLVRGGDVAIPGFTWGGVFNSRLALNDRGDWAMINGLSNGPQNQRGLMTVNKTAFLRERSSFAAITPSLISGWGNNAPVLLANTGEPFYRLEWTGPAETNLGILYGKEVLARKGVTRVQELFISDMPDGADAIAISPGGRYLLYEADMEDGQNFLVLLDIGRVTPLATCAANAGQLVRQKGFAVAGKTVTLTIDKGQGIGVTPFLMASDRPIFTYPPCGVSTPSGELLIDFGANGNPFLVQIGTPWAGNPVTITLPIPNNPLLVDLKVYVQGMFANIGNIVPGVEKLRLTNALEMEIGAP